MAAEAMREFPDFLYSESVNTLIQATKCVDMGYQLSTYIIYQS